MENVGKPKALLMVAHPDDCVIFGYPFYAIHKKFQWKICYLTYKSWDLRAQEMQKFWSKRNVETEFLGFLDDYRFVQKGITGFDNNKAKDKILESIQGYDLIVTHNQDGEYGHLHHIFVHDVVKSTPIPQVYFAGTNNLNYQVTCQPDEYHLDEMPIHRSVVEDFHDRLIGRYYVPDQVKILL